MRDQPEHDRLPAAVNETTDRLLEQRTDVWPAPRRNPLAWPLFALGVIGILVAIACGLFVRTHSTSDSPYIVVSVATTYGYPR